MSLPHDYCNVHHEWLTSHYRGLIPGQDAPDIVANTFLDQTSEDQLKQIGYAFLSHRERKFVLKLSVSDFQIRFFASSAINCHGTCRMDMPECQRQPR
jgi:hypothetical protein